MAQLKVALRGGFSDRNKIHEENTTIQTTIFDVRTKTALINITDFIIKGYYPSIDFSHVTAYRYPDEQMLLKNILADLYCQVVDWTSAVSYESVFSIIKSTISTDSYDAILTVIEYIAKALLLPYRHVVYKGKKYTSEQLYNYIFQQEYVGYRLINCQAQPITDDSEILEIQESVNNKHLEVKQHIDKALGFLSDRQAPDYANSIKESISAVERMCSIIIGAPTTLGDALKKLESNGVVIHPALKGAFSKLYGYTSDASGIRHAGELGGTDSTFEEAKFMLVSCCAFVNYLTGLMSKCP